MTKRTEVIKDLKEDYNKCNELFDIAFKLNMNENTRTEFTQKVTSYMADVLQTISFLIDEYEELLEYKNMYEDLCR